MSLALVAGAVGIRFLGTGPRRVALAAAILAACGFWALLRTDGITGEGRSQFAWRWKKTAEQQLLARAPEPVVSPVSLPVAAAEKAPEPKSAAAGRQSRRLPHGSAGSHVDWPGFRGPHRDSVVTGVRIKTRVGDLRRRWKCGAGRWDRGGRPSRWAMASSTRRSSAANSKWWRATTRPPGSRYGRIATPRVFGSRMPARVLAGRRHSTTDESTRLGATGIVNSLDAGSGAVIWTRNAASDTGAKLPGWGFASSPLVVDDLVIVAASGRLAAYDLATGAPRWVKKEGGASYSSPQLLTIAGVPQIVFMNAAGATGIAPADGKVLWKHAWEGASMLQPAVTADGGVLITTGDMYGGMGVRRLAVAQRAGWMDCQGSVDVERAEAVLQRLRGSQRLCLSDSTAAFWLASTYRTASANGRADDTATARCSC